MIISTVSLIITSNYMKKILALVLAAAFGMTMAFNASAIEDPDPVGAITVGAHAAFYPGGGGNVFADYVLFDNWWKGHFTVGAEAAFNAFSRQSVYGISVSDTRLCLVPRATYGLNILPNLEVHAGALLGLGYEQTRVSDGHSSSVDGGHIRLVIGDILGARYFLTENLGISAEMNYVSYMPYLNIGVALRF